MSKPVKQLREFDRVEVTPLWSAIEARDPGPEVPPPPNGVRRGIVAVSALALFMVAGSFAWAAFRPASGPATVGSADSTALVATLDAPDDGAIPGLSLAYGGTSRDIFAEDGHWPGVKGFDQPGFVFGDPLPPGTSLMIAGDASQVDGDLSKFQDAHSTADAEPLPLDLSGRSTTLPTDPGRYWLHLTGTWPQGTAEFFVVIQIATPAESASNFTAQDFVDGTAPLGTELADALGLTLESGFHGNCSAFVEVTNDGQGYCLQGVFGSKIDLFAISDALRGHRITEAELQTLQHNMDCAQQAEQGSMSQDCYPGSSSPAATTSVQVPDLLRLTARQAEELLASVDLNLKVGKVASGGYTNGVVTSQTPVAGRHVDVGSTVEVTVGPG